MFYYCTVSNLKSKNSGFRVFDKDMASTPQNILQQDGQIPIIHQNDFQPKIMQEENEDDYDLRLYSISEDNYLMEYNVKDSKDTLLVNRCKKIENNHSPLSLLEYKESSGNNSKSGLLISNSGYKLKFWNENNDDFECIKTQLGPLYGSPVTEMEELDLSNTTYVDDDKQIKSN